jgi:hypothetical protein
MQFFLSCFHFLLWKCNLNFFSLILFSPSFVLILYSIWFSARFSPKTRTVGSQWENRPEKQVTQWELPNTGPNPTIIQFTCLLVHGSHNKGGQTVSRSQNTDGDGAMWPHKHPVLMDNAHSLQNKKVANTTKAIMFATKGLEHTQLSHILQLPCWIVIVDLKWKLVTNNNQHVRECRLSLLLLIHFPKGGTKRDNVRGWIIRPNTDQYTIHRETSYDSVVHGWTTTDFTLVIYPVKHPTFISHYLGNSLCKWVDIVGFKKVGNVSGY